MQVAGTPPKEATICKSTFSTRRVRHKAQPSAEDSGRCSGAAARWFVTPKRPGATCGAGEEYQEKYGPHGLPVLGSGVHIHRGASGARAFSLASCAAGDFFGLLASVPRLRDHTPAPQGRRRQAPQDRRRLTFFWGGAEIRRSRLWSLKSVLDVLRVPAARPGTRHFRAEHVAGKARSGASRGVRLGSKALQDPSRPPRASRPPDLKTF